jgi:hypothetical protein
VRRVLRARNTSRFFVFIYRSNNFRYIAIPPQNLLLRIAPVEKHRCIYACDHAENSDLSACRAPDSFMHARPKTDTEVAQLTSKFLNTMSCKLVEDNLSLKSYSQVESKHNITLQVSDPLTNLTEMEMCVCIPFNIKRFFCVAYGGWCCATFCCVFAAAESLCRQIGTASSPVVLGLVPCATAARAQMTTHWARSMSAAEAAPRPTAFHL